MPDTTVIPARIGRVLRTQEFRDNRVPPILEGGARRNEQRFTKKHMRRQATQRWEAGATVEWNGRKMLPGSDNETSGSRETLCDLGSITELLQAPTPDLGKESNSSVSCAPVQAGCPESRPHSSSMPALPPIPPPPQLAQSP